MVVGRTGSGKTQLIAKILGPAHPRRITVDATGECRRLYPNALTVHSIAEAAAALRFWMTKGFREWHLVVALEPDQVGALVAMLCPVYDGKTPAIAAALNGVALECYELDAYMPVSGMNGELSRAWRTAFARGRHVNLSILGATQRPHQVDRMATAQAQLVVTFAMHEPADVKWLRDVGGERFATIARNLAPYHSAWYWANDGRVELRDDRYRVVKTLRVHDQDPAAT